MKKVIRRSIAGTFALTALLSGCGSSAAATASTASAAASAAPSESAAPASSIAASDTPVQISFGNNAVDMARTLNILQGAGFLKLKDGVGYSAELSDVEQYYYNIELVPVDGNTLVGTLDDFGAAFINNTYAVPAGLSPKNDSILRESQSSEDNPYRNILAVRTEDKDSDWAQAILKAYQQENVAEYLLLKYDYANLPAFDYDENFTPDDSIVETYDSYNSPTEGKKVVKVGVVGGNNDQWRVVQKNLDDAGANITIELVSFDGYDLPNDALHNKDIDMHACVTQAFFESDAASQNITDLSLLGYTIIAPLSLYSKKVKSVDELKQYAGKKE